MEEPRRTRQSSRQNSSQERRNSVSEITDYFSTLSNEQMDSHKKPAKSKKEKEKERKQELREIKANIKAMIFNDEESEKSSLIANGEDANQAERTLNMPNSPCLTNPSAISESANEESDAMASHTAIDEILKAVKELAVKYNKIENDIHDPKLGISAQLAKTQDKVTNLHTDIHGAVSGLEVRMSQVTETANANEKQIKQIKDSQKRMGALLAENKRLVQELKVMQGLVQKVSKQSLQQCQQITDLTKRGMEQNLVIHGMDNTIEIEDARKENPDFSPKDRCKQSVIKFVADNLRIMVTTDEIWKAHRMGQIKPGKVRPMVVKMSYNAKDRIMENVSVLKGLKNPTTQQTYFISEQIPDGVMETRKQVAARVKSLKNDNEKKPKEERSNISVVGDKILVDGELDEPEVTTPQPAQLFLDEEAQAKVDEVQTQLIETPPETIRNSEFIALAVKADTISKVQRAYIAVAQRYPAADHIMLAYALKEGGKLKAGGCDDREFGAAAKIRDVIFDLKSKDTAVFVLRKYGGVHLGFNRFEAIQKVTRRAIMELAARG